MFASSVNAMLNWIATRVEIALTREDEQQREFAARSLPALLEDPISLTKIERLIDMIG
jgi:hypothetical protein